MLHGHAYTINSPLSGIHACGILMQPANISKIFTVFIMELKMDAHMIILHAGMLYVILPHAFVST